MTVKEIVEIWLSEHGFEGLSGADRLDGCGCLLGNLMPCGASFDDCAPAFLWECAGCGNADGCNLAADALGCWRPEKQEKKP